MDRNKEYIVAAAYLLKPEFVQKALVYKDPSIQTHPNEGDDIYRCEIGRSHADIIHRHGGRILMNTGGFYTNFGRYVTREEAYEIAKANQQVNPLYTCDKPSREHKARLFSEDVFWKDEDYEGWA